MKPTEEQIRDFINITLQEWQEYAVSTLRESAKKRKLNITQETINSLSSQVLKASSNDLAAVMINFVPSGRIKDMKVVTHTKPLSEQVIKDSILKWVQKVGVGKFARVPGYKTGSFPSENIAARRIAWGIGKGIMKGKWVRKQWYAKRMAGNIKNLTERLITDYQTVISKSMAAQISGKE
jgi:hypothetical protein